VRSPQQIVTPLPGEDALAISGSAELELGARGMLLLLDGAFRLDVCPMGDTLKLAIRGLDGAELTSRGGGYSGGVIAHEEQFERIRELHPSSFDLTVEIRDGERSRGADVVVAALRIPNSGKTRFTAQAIVTPS
jgi:hypothetical protein